MKGRLLPGRVSLSLRHLGWRRSVLGWRRRLEENRGDAVRFGGIHLHSHPEALPACTRLCDHDKPDIGRFLYFLEIEAPKLVPHLDCLIDEVRASALGHGFCYEGLNGGAVAAFKRSEPGLELLGCRRIGKREMGFPCRSLGQERPSSHCEGCECRHPSR